MKRSFEEYRTADPDVLMRLTRFYDGRFTNRVNHSIVNQIREHRLVYPGRKFAA